MQRMMGQVSKCVLMLYCTQVIPQKWLHLFCNMGFMAFFITDVDIMWVSISVLLYFVALFAILWWIPGCFTIGEAMIVTQAVVLVAIDSYANLGIKVNMQVKD